MSENTGTPVAVLETNCGKIEFEFFQDAAPDTCKNFIKLADAGYYNGLVFHRVIKGFMIQGGCPDGTGTGGPGYQIKAEFNDNSHVLGTVSMARSSDPDSAGSQFFICLGATPHLDGQYTAFGQVTEGVEFVEKIGVMPTGSGDRPTENVIMEKVEIDWR